MNRIKISFLVLAFLSLTIVFSQSRNVSEMLFNGKDLSGWKQINGSATYEVRDGMIVGTTVNSPVNSFLVTEKTYSDFELEVEFKMDSVNSGIQFRSESKGGVQNGRVFGYQVDFDPTARQWTGGIYDESRRGWIYPLTYHPQGKTAFHAQEWNHCRIRCVKNSIQVWINHQPTASLVDDATLTGFIGLQVHGVYRPEDVGKKIYWQKLHIRPATAREKIPGIFTADLIKARTQPGFQVAELPAEKKVSIRWADQLIAEYVYPDSLFKPVLYPLQTLSGLNVTRNYPFKRVAGERADHPHQAGVFFTHESVNGFDFWNLSTAIPLKNRSAYGRIVHTRTVCAQGLPDRATLITTSRWQSYDGSEALLEELTTHVFTRQENWLIYDRTTELRALQPVQFKEQKDALLGIRVARALELPNEWVDPFVESNLQIGSPRKDNSRATGNFLNQSGQQGETVWGKRSPWLALSGQLESKNISLLVFDHPANLNHPPHWHARGYGLVAANPLGTSIFSEGQSPTNLQLRPGERIAFRYRLLLSEEKLTPAQIEKRYQQFLRP
jgi:hypothetical protein